MRLLGFRTGLWLLLPAWAVGRTVVYLISRQRKQAKQKGLPPDPAFMLVCDLNETLLGEDSSTQAFKQFWEDTGVVRGGVLVYNTGRSLQATQHMLLDKAHCLPRPSVLICSLGTRICWEREGQWQEDAAWSAAVSSGWDVGGVKQACNNLMCSDPHLWLQLHSVDEFKVTCLVQCPLLEEAQCRVQGALQACSLAALAISSGQGEQRFLTLVPIKAGKLAAQEHVRNRCNIPLSNTISCGDSGNDRLMLSGSNPAVVVGNAEPELIQWAQQQQAAHPRQLGPNGRHRLYLAQGHEALGVLEGLRQLGYM